MVDMIARTCCSLTCVIVRTNWVLDDDGLDDDSGDLSPREPSENGLPGKSCRASSTLSDSCDSRATIDESFLFSELVVSVVDEAVDSGS